MFAGFVLKGVPHTLAGEFDDPMADFIQQNFRAETSVATIANIHIAKVVHEQLRVFTPNAKLDFEDEFGTKDSAGRVQSRLGFHC